MQQFVLKNITGINLASLCQSKSLNFGQSYQKNGSQNQNGGLHALNALLRMKSTRILGEILDSLGVISIFEKKSVALFKCLDSLHFLTASIY